VVCWVELAHHLAGVRAALQVMYTDCFWCVCCCVCIGHCWEGCVVCWVELARRLAGVRAALQVICTDCLWCMCVGVCV